MAVEMARGKQYSLAIPYLAYAYQTLGEFQATLCDVKRTYGPWALVLGWLGMYFPQAHNKCVRRTRFSLSFTPCKANFSSASVKDPSRLFWYIDQVTL